MARFQAKTSKAAKHFDRAKRVRENGTRKDYLALSEVRRREPQSLGEAWRDTVGANTRGWRGAKGKHTRKHTPGRE